MSAISRRWMTVDFAVIAPHRSAITPLSPTTRVRSRYWVSSNLEVNTSAPMMACTESRADSVLVTAELSNLETFGASCSRCDNACDPAHLEKTCDCGLLAGTGGAYGL